MVCFAAVNGLNNFRVGCLTSLPSEGRAINTDSYRVCRDLQTGVSAGQVVKVDCRNADTCRYVIIQSLDTVAEKLCIAEACVLETSQYIAGMLTRPAGHEAKAEAEVRKSESEDEAEAQNFFFEAEAEARHVREQLSVYEHED